LLVSTRSTEAGPWSSKSQIDERGEADRVQTGAPHQESVNFRLPHEAAGIVGLYAAAIQDAQVVRSFLSETPGRLRADETVSIGGDFRGGCLSVADRPDWLVADYDSRELFVRESGDAALELFP
jgi:hypothetical protein